MGDFFHTDWASLTLHDWIGLIMTVAVFFLMIWAYMYAFSPKNREKFESQRHILDDEDYKDMENKP